MTVHPNAIHHQQQGQQQQQQQTQQQQQHQSQVMVVQPPHLQQHAQHFLTNEEKGGIGTGAYFDKEVEIIRAEVADSNADKFAYYNPKYTEAEGFAHVMRRGAASLPSRQLFVGGIMPSITESALWRLFSLFGEVEQIKSFINRGYAFIVYKNIQISIWVREQMNLFPPLLGGRSLVVNFGRPTESETREAMAGEDFRIFNSDPDLGREPQPAIYMDESYQTLLPNGDTMPVRHLPSSTPVAINSMEGILRMPTGVTGGMGLPGVPGMPGIPTGVASYVQDGLNPYIFSTAAPSPLIQHIRLQPAYVPMDQVQGSGSSYVQVTRQQ